MLLYVFVTMLFIGSILFLLHVSLVKSLLPKTSEIDTINAYMHIHTDTQIYKHINT